MNQDKFIPSKQVTWGINIRLQYTLWCSYTMTSTRNYPVKVNNLDMEKQRLLMWLYESDIILPIQSYQWNCRTVYIAVYSVDT